MADSSRINFTLQRLVEIRARDPLTLLEQDIARAKYFFPSLIEKREDSLVGRGHHESYHQYMPTGQVICFLWDEDHDERVYIAAYEILRMLDSNTQSLILMLAERKGSLTIVTTNEQAKKSIKMNISDEIEVCGDIWPVEIINTEIGLDNSTIIHSGSTDFTPYLKNLIDTREAITHLMKCLELRDIEVLSRKKNRS